MVYNWWKSHDPDMIIRMADDKDIKYLFKRGHNRIPIGPTERAVFIKNGKMLGLIDQDTIKIADQWDEKRIDTVYWKKEDDEGKFKRFFKRLAGVKKEVEYDIVDYYRTIQKRVVDGHINVLIVDATTLDLDFSIGPREEVYTADARENITGNLTVRFHFDPLETPKQMNLLSESKAMTKKGLSKRIWNEIMSEVIKPVLNGFNSDEIYGNRDVREMAEMAVMHEMEKTFDMWGIKLKKVIFNLDTPERVKMDHELAKKKAELDQEMAMKELSWKKAGAERLHRKEVEIREWEDGLERRERERQYQLRLRKEKEEWEDERKEKVRDEGKRIEGDKMVLEEEKKELELKFQRREFDEGMYRVKQMQLIRRERELDMDKRRQNRIEGHLKVEWDRHRIKMDKEEQRLEGELKMRQQAHLEEMERIHQEHLREIEKGKPRGEVIRRTDEQIKQLQREIHELEMAIVDAPVEKIIYLKDMIKEKTEQLRIIREGGTEDIAITTGGSTGDKYMDAKKEAASKDAYVEVVHEEREYQEGDKQWARDAIDRTVGSMQRVQEAQAAGLGGGRAPSPEKSPKDLMMAEFKELKEMKEMGMLTEEEFEERRKKLIGKYGV